EIALGNLPVFVVDEPYVITEIKLFYYGLPSEQEEQYLTPAWGVRVYNSAWIYVDAFTGEILAQ
ncbi:MAG: hypothetical protein ACYSUV_09220, partial [Planctomycetota bacterium]